MPQHEPEVLDNKQLQLPPHPRGWNCGECPAYLANVVGERYEYSAFVMPDGTAVPENQLHNAAIPVSAWANQPKVRESLCTRNPSWVRVARKHWCWAFPIVRKEAAERES